MFLWDPKVKCVCARLLGHRFCVMFLSPAAWVRSYLSCSPHVRWVFAYGMWANAFECVRPVFGRNQFKLPVGKKKERERKSVALYEKYQALQTIPWSHCTIVSVFRADTITLKCIGLEVDLCAVEPSGCDLCAAWAAVVAHAAVGVHVLCLYAAGGFIWMFSFFIVAHMG